jgi:hypothetical protein
MENTMSDQENNGHSLQDDRPPRTKVRLTFTIALWLVIILLLIAIFSPVRDVVINRFLTSAPTPTPTIVAGGNQFYIQANPQGIVTIDGHTVTNLPDPNNNQPPLTLSRGEHKIEWQSPPFLPLTCIVSVPPILNEPCNYESIGNYSNDSSARVISFTASITNLPNDQQTALKQAIQVMLNSLQSTDTLSSGEQYVYKQSAGGTIVKTAPQPLNATLSLHLDTNPNSSNSCTTNGDLCSLSGQNCLQICSDGGKTSSKGVFTWNIIALYYATWTYTTQSGQVVVQNQPDTNYTTVGVDHSIDLEATWNGKEWNVSLPTYNASSAILPITTPIACASIHSLVGSSTNYGSGASAFTATQGSNPRAVDWSYFADSNEAQGCLGVVILSQDATATPTNSKQPHAYFLYRFGVLLAANALAHNEFPSVPLADAYEQSIAQQIAAHHNM